MMNAKSTVSRLPGPEHCGDWHDKPLRWEVIVEGRPDLHQKFSTKKDAISWRRVIRLNAEKSYSALFHIWMTIQGVY